MKTDPTRPANRKPRVANSDLLPIPHPGETLHEDFMVPLGLTNYAVAKSIGSTPITVSMIVRGQRSISPEMALRLSRYTGTSAEFWMNLQAHYDLKVARRKVEAKIKASIIPLGSASEDSPRRVVRTSEEIIAGVAPSKTHVQARRPVARPSVAVKAKPVKRKTPA